MRKGLVAVGLLVSGLAFGQADLQLKSENSVSIADVKCGAVGADLDFAMRGKTAAEPSVYVTLKNFYTVIQNSPQQTLRFHIHNDSVGWVQLSNGVKRWNVNRAVSKNSVCDVEVTRETRAKDPTGNTVYLKLRCEDLVPRDRRSGILGLAELTEPVRCSIAPQKS